MKDKPSQPGCYAKQASDAYQASQGQRQWDLLMEVELANSNAQVPGRRDLRLMSEDMVIRMRPGAVVVDVKVAQGVN